MILEKTLPLLLLFLIGFFLKKKGILRKEDGHVLSKLLVNLVIPAVVITAFSTVTIEPKLLLLPLAGLILVASLFGISFLLAWLLKLRGKTKSAFIISFPTLEGGTIGYPFMLAVFGSIGLSRILLFDLGNALFLFTIIYALASVLGKGKEQFHFFKGLSQLVTSPIMLAIGIGILFNIFNISIPVLTNLLTVIGSSIIFLVMILLGLEFELSASSFKLPFLTIFFKTSIGLALGFLLSFLFGFTGIERIAVIVGSSLPASFVTLVFAKENDLDATYLANMLPLAFLISILFMTLLIPFLK